MLGERQSVFTRLFRRFFGDGRGNVTVMMTLLLVPIIGATGMGAEASNWYLTQRAIQNAADSAVLAAATNGCDSACNSSSGEVTYDHEGLAAAAKLGFVNTGDTSVAVTNAATCPTGGSTCYGVTITRDIPIYMLGIVGFKGNSKTTANLRAQRVVAVAKANRFPGSTACVTATGSDPKNNKSAVTLNGGPNADFSGCYAYTPNGSATCNGNGGNFLGAEGASEPNNSNKACAALSAGLPWTDPFAALSSSVGTSTANCPGGVTPDGGGKKGTSAVISIGSVSDLNKPQCGNAKLTGPITIPAGTDAVVTLYGYLDLNGQTLKTDPGASLTLIFTGDSAGSTASHVLQGSGTLNISSPTTGTWKGIAVYQDDARLTSGIDYTAAGSSPALLISGLFYAPNADVTASGNIKFSDNGTKCLAFIVKTFQINGAPTINDGTTTCKSQQGLDGLHQVNNLAKLVS